MMNATGPQLDVQPERKVQGIDIRTVWWPHYLVPESHFVRVE
uniref:Uncharacterized protein n=1 Tax=Lepeophtheirus salmonis TaxID=72036 RepID=A0A0K2T1I7_LEPSM